MMFWCRLGQRVSAAQSSLETFTAAVMAEVTIAISVLVMFRPPRGITITLMSSLRSTGLIAALVVNSFTFLAKWSLVLGLYGE